MAELAEYLQELRGVRARSHAPAIAADLSKVAGAPSPILFASDDPPTVARTTFGESAASSIQPGQRGIDSPHALIQTRTLAIVDKMMLNESVGTFIEMKIGAALACKWDIEPAVADDPKQVEIAEQTLYAYEQMRGTVEEAMQDMFTAVPYGFSVTNIVYELFDEGPWRGKVGIKHLKTKEPHNVRFDVDEFRNLKELGILWNDGMGMDEALPTNEFAVYSYRRKFYNPYGYGDCLRAYDRWNSLYWANKFWDIRLEREGTGAIVAIYKKDANPSKQEHDVVKDYIQNKQVRSGIKVSSAWEITHHEANAQGSSMFAEAVDHRNIAIARALFFPDQLGFSAKAGGSYALGKKHFDVFVWIIQKLHGDMAGVMDEQVIRRLVELNWGVQDAYPKFTFAPLTDEQKVTWLTNVFTALEKGAVTPDLEIENAVRKALEFAEKEQEDEDKAGGGPPLSAKPKPDPDEPDEDGDVTQLQRFIDPFIAKEFTEAWAAHNEADKGKVLKHLENKPLTYSVASALQLGRTKQRATALARWAMVATGMNERIGGILPMSAYKGMSLTEIEASFGAQRSATPKFRRRLKETWDLSYTLAAIHEETLRGKLRIALLNRVKGDSHVDVPAVFSEDTERASAMLFAAVAEDMDVHSTQFDFEKILAELKKHPRVIIAGGPRTGKSTIAVRAGERFEREVRHGDALVGKLEWSESSKEVASWFDEDGEWIVEGVVAPRAIRKYLAANPGKKLDATVLYLENPIQVRNKGQDTMAAGVKTVWDEVLPQLKAAGVKVLTLNAEGEQT